MFAPRRRRGRDHCCDNFAVIEAPFEFGRRPHDVLLAHTSVRADDGLLNVAEHRVDPLERGMTHGPAARAGRQGDALATSIRQSAKAGQPVGDHGCAGGAAQLNGRDALLGLRDGIHNAEPRRQRHLGRGEHDSRGQRRLAATSQIILKILFNISKVS